MARKMIATTANTRLSAGMADWAEDPTKRTTLHPIAPKAKRSPHQGARFFRRSGWSGIAPQSIKAAECRPTVEVQSVQPWKSGASAPRQRAELMRASAPVAVLLREHGVSADSSPLYAIFDSLPNSSP